MNEEEAIIFVRDMYVGDKMVSDTGDCGRYCFLHGIEVGYYHGVDAYDVPNNRCDRYTEGIKVGKRAEQDSLIVRILG